MPRAKLDAELDRVFSQEFTSIHFFKKLLPEYSNCRAVRRRTIHISPIEIAYRWLK
jgi:hypothetical protein